jgi:hypothetical protein
MRCFFNIKFLIEWNLSVDTFVEELKKFRFRKVYCIDNETIYLMCPDDYKLEDENALLGILINLTFRNCIRNKYDLR